MNRIALFLMSISLLSACNAQQQASYVGKDYVMGDLPADVCRVEGVPQLVSLSIEQGNDLDLNYLDTQGRFVNQKYGGGVTGVGTGKRGKVLWTRAHQITCDAPLPAAGAAQ